MKYSHPLNYKPSLVDFGTRTLIFRCTDGRFAIKLKPTFFVTGLRLELRTSQSKCDMLTITLSGISVGLMIPIAIGRTHIIVSETIASSVGLQAFFNSGSYGSRTRGDRSTICNVSRYTNEPCNLYRIRTGIIK